MRIWKKIIKVGDSKAVVLDKKIIRGKNIDFGDKVLIDLIKFKKKEKNE